MVRRELVHGLYICVPLRDYHLAFLIKALDLAIEYYGKRDLKNCVSYCKNLKSSLSVALGLLVKKTKQYNMFLKHNPLIDDPPVPFKSPSLEIYMDPKYFKNHIKIERVQKKYFLNKYLKEGCNNA